jgi:hypothetical protein
MEAPLTEWDGLRILLAANLHRPPRNSLSEEELVRLVIDFVNAPTLLGQVKLMARDPAPDLRVTLNADDLQRRFGKDMTPERAIAISNQAIADETKLECEQVRGDLQALIDHAVDSQALARLTTSASQQALLPVFTFDKDGLGIKYRYRVNSLAPVLDYAVLLLLDRKRNFGKELCRCKLGGCGKFFLASRSTGGRPRTEYCEKAHMEQAHKAAAAQRAENSRKSRARKARRIPALTAAKHK